MDLQNDHFQEGDPLLVNPIVPEAGHQLIHMHGSLEPRECYLTGESENRSTWCRARRSWLEARRCGVPAKRQATAALRHVRLQTILSAHCSEH